ncbi:MAG: hypothetical protein ACI88A_000342 [Paraglaciecola sp.]|jgi:hypothetical protein
MKNIVLTINLAVLIMLCSAAGIAKVLQVPDEVIFFQDAGLSPNLLVLLGAFQLIAAVLLVLKNWRNIGANIAGISFLVSTMLIFINGQNLFGMLSFLPLILVYFVLRKEKHKAHSN